MKKEEKGIFIPWDERYSLGIPLVDDQHEKLLDLANALYDACREGSTSAKDAFRDAAHDIVEYVKVHFSTEEKLMKRVNFPETAEHKEEHREFVKQFLAEVKAFEDGKPFVSHAFANFLKDWILKHVAQTDKRMGNYLLAMAKKGELNLNQPDSI